MRRALVTLSAHACDFAKVNTKENQHIFKTASNNKNTGRATKSKAEVRAWHRTIKTDYLDVHISQLVFFWLVVIYLTSVGHMHICMNFYIFLCVCAAW